MRRVDSHVRLVTHAGGYAACRGDARTVVACWEGAADVRDAAVQELEQYVRQSPTRVRHAELLRKAANRLLRTDDPYAAVKLYHRFAAVSDSLGRVLRPEASKLEAKLRYE